ncbi:OmpH family outer membrane protein [Pseudodesulfovibrio cashew]|uniref:OmpH family outer membrane protein n=1 Tax=Pseudodesulfovibrio cashew TaxID=2678688 RepID=A0A6I6JAE0_9BACT|nr:OmpH family outer membrane protein [Pseudodesulfovibrio cashew]QGY39726.1 OmpH family outer membrane protein [Pseudodesulfovibrio cashew]
MQRTLTLLGAALISLMILAGCDQKPGVTIGVVDEAAVFQKNQAASKAMAYLQELGAPLQEKAEAAYKQMQKEQTEENVAAYKAAMGELQNVMRGEERRLVELIDAKLNEVLDTYREQKGLTVILSKESVVSASSTIDVTDDVVAAMNAVEIDFTPPAKAAAEKEEPAGNETKEGKE